MAQEAEAPEAQEAEETTTEVAVKETTTFDADYVKTLRAEAARHRKEAQEAKAKAAEYEERDKSELEKLSGKLSKLEQEKANAEGALLRYEVAAEKQVPADALDLLTGNTREELEAKADKLLELVKSRNTNESPDFDGGAREPADEPLDPEQQHSKDVLKLLGLAT
jgi:hypothetical protein